MLSTCFVFTHHSEYRRWINADIRLIFIFIRARAKTDNGFYKSVLISKYLLRNHKHDILLYLLAKHYQRIFRYNIHITKNYQHFSKFCSFDNNGSNRKRSTDIWYHYSYGCCYSSGCVWCSSH